MNLLKIFRDYRQFEIFLLGVLSGMPLSIIFTTIAAWLSDEHIALEIITTFAVARMPYSLKFLWAPLVDYLKIPMLHNLGQRKSWLLLCTITIAVVLLAISVSSPQKHLTIFYLLTILLGFFSATFDISVDAYRIEKFEAELLGVATANSVFGYRLGCLITGAFALQLTYYNKNWSQTFLIMSIIFFAAIFFVLTLKEQSIIQEKTEKLSFGNLLKLTINPFKDLLQRKYALIILLAVVLYKLGEAMLGVVCIPFYKEMGFSWSEVAFGVKYYGLFATILGVYIGGFLIYRIGYTKALILGGLLQSITHVTFIWLHHQGTDYYSLIWAVGIENFASGIGSSVLTSFLSVLCNKKFAATQYALLSSSASLANNFLVMYGGSLVKMMGWDNYFVFTIFLGLPAILLLIYLNKKLLNNKDLQISNFKS